jgi:hypothetical protein
MWLILTESRVTGTDETKRAKNSTLVGGRLGYCESEKKKKKSNNKLLITAGSANISVIGKSIHPLSNSRISTLKFL